MRVRVEHLEQPLGIGVRRAAAVVAAAGRARPQQVAYELAVDGWAPAASSRPTDVLVAVAGSSRWPPASGVEVRVRVWTDLGESDWSEPTALGDGAARGSPTGPAAWVEPGRALGGPGGVRPAYLLRGEVHVDRSRSRPRGCTSPHTGSTSRS